MWDANGFGAAAAGAEPGAVVTPLQEAVGAHVRNTGALGMFAGKDQSLGISDIYQSGASLILILLQPSSGRKYGIKMNEICHAGDAVCYMTSNTMDFILNNDEFHTKCVVACERRLSQAGDILRCGREDRVVEDTTVIISNACIHDCSTPHADHPCLITNLASSTGAGRRSLQPLPA